MKTLSFDRGGDDDVLPTKEQAYATKKTLDQLFQEPPPYCVDLDSF
jgi:hypothetical protein